MTTPRLHDALSAIADGREIDAASLQQLRADDAAAAELVEQVADRFARLHRRDSQFAAVVAMTHDLVTQRDGALLDRIVDRAHELLGSDMTYISAYDAGSETFEVRAVQGASSPDFLGMVVPRGVGIATRVVKKMSPVWVDNYPDAAEFPHDTVIDSVVAAEEISSILGVPLIADRTILGVLFVADRRARRYTPDEIGLARSFADHAAIVFEQGKLVAELHAASKRADRDRRLAESQASEIRRAAGLHEELTRLVTAGSDPDTVAKALGDTLRRRIVVIDADGDVIAGAEDLVPDEALPKQFWSDIADGRGTEVASGPVEFVAPVVAQQSAAGAVLVERTDEELTLADRRSVERSGIAFALLWMQRKASDLAEERIRGELAKELIDTTGSREHAIDRVRSRGLSPTKPWVAVHFGVEAAAADRVRQTLRLGADLLVTETGGVFWVLAQEGAVHQRVESALRAAGVDAPLTAVHRAEDLVSLLEVLPSVRGARDFLLAMGERTGTFDTNAFAPYTVLFDGNGERAVAFIAEALQPLLEWDARRGTELFETLVASMDEQGSTAGVARRLGLHPNTVRQRLDRIASLIPGGWTVPDARFRLEVAVRLEAARRALQA
ncbi:MAG TPA: GAF domain-containing protein [Candidatus Agrococcus pullicola]|uniref:GAF domain-containing protein n=1 Tax=Candidatus Agrococcus pullicola TaxID=2838429 RepID=A0A9D1YXF0_9MICO|nr:GAF domain-containing protein [Candidatus Agrococcus pullicola]